jgi:hypothetical protein
MGGSKYSHDDYAARTGCRAFLSSTMGIPMEDATFKYSHDIKTGKVAAKVHPSLDPKGVKIRESRDSDTHPVSVPVAVIFDTTGSMQDVPITIQKKLSSLMGCFLDDKASGKKYLGEGYPAIMLGAVDDWDAMLHWGHGGTFQIGQFESGIEIDDNLTNLWLTGQGGGTYDEEYELAVYFMARHTVHDHFEKRGRKGYLFLIGDEHAYRELGKHKVLDVLGETIQDDISFEDILKEAQQKYHVFMIIPNLTNHYGDAELERWWVDKLGQQNVIKLEEPEKICETIVSAVAICEEYVGLDELVADGVADGKMSSALVHLAKSTGEVSRYSADGLPKVAGTAGGAERL